MTALLLGVGAGSAASPPCDTNDRWSGCSTGTIEDDDAVLRGGSGSGETGDGSGSGSTVGGDARDDGTESGAGDPCFAVECDPAFAPRDDYEVVIIRMSDIARFRPSLARQAMEPNGWAVAGLPANIFAHAPVEVVSGSLLGQPAQVRFTPTAFRWDYGDGSAAKLHTAGRSWAETGASEFATTPTSHIYATTGEHTIRLDVTYRAEYRIAGGPFVPIAGALTLPANELQVQVRSPKTVLVDQDCSSRRVGPGC